MQNSAPLFPSIGSLLGVSSSFLFSNGELSEGSLEISRALFLVPFLLFQGGGKGDEEARLGMDLSMMREKILSSIRSARSLGLFPSADDLSARPEIPARAAAAAVVARALAALPHQQIALPSSSSELRSMYESWSQNSVVEELEEIFYDEDFDPIMRILDGVPPEDIGLEFFERQATLRLSQLDVISERLSSQVMEHREVMVKGMNLVSELENDLSVAITICMNGRERLTSSMNEVSRDLVVHYHAKKKQLLLDVLYVLVQLRRAVDMQEALETLVENGDFCKAFQVLSEYLQLLDSLSDFSSVQDMSRGVEVWLGATLQKMDSLLLGLCQNFSSQTYLMVVDAYALIGDVPGLSEKIQSFFMQEILSETLSVLKNIVHENQILEVQNSRFTYSDLCIQIPESKFRQCLLRTLAILFRLMCSYYEIMSFEPDVKDLSFESFHGNRSEASKPSHGAGNVDETSLARDNSTEEVKDVIDPTVASDSTIRTDTESEMATMDYQSKNCSSVTISPSNESPWYYLRRDATSYVSQTLDRGRKSLWQLMTTRIAVLLSVVEAGSTSVHQFLKNFEDINGFILAGEAFSGLEAVDFRKKLKAACESYFSSLHRQHSYALKMVLEKETWAVLPVDLVNIVHFPGLVGDGAPLIASSLSTLASTNAKFHAEKSLKPDHSMSKTIGFMKWARGDNPFLSKLSPSSIRKSITDTDSGTVFVEYDDNSPASRSSDKISPKAAGVNVPFDSEDEDLLADFIDEDSQLPSRTTKQNVFRSGLSNWKSLEAAFLTGSSLCLLRSMDKYARLMQKLELLNVELFKGISQLFGIYFFFTYETFVSSSGKSFSDPVTSKLKAALARISQDCDQLLKSQTPSISTTSTTTYSHHDVTPTSPLLVTSSGLKERCSGVYSLSYVAQILTQSKSNLQSMLLLKSPALVDEFYSLLVDSVPDLVSQIHKTTARLMLQIQGFADKIASAKWDVRELGFEHNGYVDLLLGEFKHYKSKLASGGIDEKMQEVLSEYGVEVVGEVLVEGLSRVKRCTDEGRALMSLDLQVLINGLKHFVSVDVKSKFQMVESFIKAYYLPETEYVHWSRSHPEYSRNQVSGLVNLVAAMKGWKRKTRLEILDNLL